MTPNAFFDTNVLIDVLLERQPFVADSRRVWFLAERGRIRGLVSALSFPNVHYVVRATRGTAAAMEMMAMLRGSFGVAPCDAQILDQAMDSDLSDFEDAIQYFSALRAGADCILTRNTGDFPRRPAIPVVSPREFLAQLEAE
jgi:predicted nucleic acid-binding protein